jgi:hypothetical protein
VSSLPVVSTKPVASGNGTIVASAKPSIFTSGAVAGQAGGVLAAAGLLVAALL